MFWLALGYPLLAHLAVNLDGEQLAREYERREQPELGVERAEGAGAEPDQRYEQGQACRADDSQVEGEG